MNLWTLNYKQTFQLVSRNPNEPFSPYKWQIEFDEFSDKRLVSLTASTGAGKSYAIKLNAKRWLVVINELEILRIIDKK